jgi:GntR family transcriptional regulator, transcriptional repressor for pyruvate dehydrogenase complex
VLDCRMVSLKKERLSKLVTDAILEIIEIENLKPGDRFYSEHQLMAKLEVSRSSVREAVRMLEVTGMVKVQQGKGIFIAEPQDDDIHIRGWVVDNTELLKEHFEVRLLMEPHAAALAARKVGDKELEELSGVYNRFKEALAGQDIASAITCDSEFHLLIAKYSCNRTLSVLMKTMAGTLNEGWITSLNTPGRLERTVVEHGAILDALRAGDPEGAAQGMRDHLNNALADIQKYTTV